MAGETFSNGEKLDSVRAKINAGITQANAADQKAIAALAGVVGNTDQINNLGALAHLNDADWNADIINKPTTFPPTAHTHDYTSEITGKPATFPPSSHSHDYATEITGKPATFPPSVHSHAIADVTDLQTALDGKIAAANLTYTAASRLLAIDVGTDVTLPLFTSANGGLVPGSGGGTLNFLRADGTWSSPPAGGGSGISDGDKGDISVTSSAAVWTIDPSAVTNAKMANMNAGTVKGRTVAAGAGAPVDLTQIELTALINPATTSLPGSLSAADKTKLDSGFMVQNGDRGDVTVSISGTNWVIDSGAVSTLKIADNAVDNAKLANMAQGTVKGRVTAITGDPEDLTSAQLTTLIAPATTSLQGAMSAADKLKLDGLTGGVADGDKGDINVLAGNWAIDPGVVTNAKLANMASGTMKGRVTAGAGVPEDLTSTQVTALLNAATVSLQGMMSAADKTMLNTLNTDAVRTSRTIIAGNGLVTGGDLTANVTIDMGTPSDITDLTTSAVTPDGHSHALPESAVRNLIALGPHGGVGTYAFLGKTDNLAAVWGTTYAGSVLSPGGMIQIGTVVSVYWTGAHPGGTWKCMGQTMNAAQGTATLFLRVL